MNYESIDPKRELSFEERLKIIEREFLYHMLFESELRLVPMTKELQQYQFYFGCIESSTRT